MQPLNSALDVQYDAYTYCNVWICDMGEKTLLTTKIGFFAKVQHLICLCITEARRSCPTMAINFILDLRPLQLVTERQTTMGAVRLRIINLGQRTLYNDVTCLVY